jgi:NodT family efflux transporter outer membrane factor (OMF) lipoprotein
LRPVAIELAMDEMAMEKEDCMSAFRFTATTQLLALLLVLLCGCTVGPAYRPPAEAAPGGYKELPAATPAAVASDAGNGAGSDGNGNATPHANAPVTIDAGWKRAQPHDDAIRGDWWELFDDPQLSALERQANGSNQTIAAAFAAFVQARSLIIQARSQYYPTLTVAPGVTRSRQSATQSGAASGTYTEYSLPFGASWTPDLWGRVRNTVKGDIAAAQASAADLQNTRLTAQAELAVDYYELRSQDALQQLLDATVKAYQQSLTLTQALYETGIDDDESVAQAQVQLQLTQAQATNAAIARAQYEHAIALLVGQPASTFSIAVQPGPLQVALPAVPVSLPSQLLERRPDIAASERLMAQANAQIGVATSAYYPTLTLSASAGFENTSLSHWLTWPSRFWSVGSSLSETLFDAGLRRAAVQQYQAAYDQAVANYRQTVLTAFGQVEDNLAALRILATEIKQQDEAVASAQRLLGIATNRYQLGIDPYLDVLTAQTTLLSAQQTAVSLHLQQLTAIVQLIETLGGGWDASQLPSAKDVARSNVSP